MLYKEQMLLEIKYKHSEAVSNKQSVYIKIDSKEISIHSILFWSNSRVKWTKCWYIWCVELGEHHEAAESKLEMKELKEDL